MPQSIPVQTTVRALISRNLDKIGLQAFSVRTNPIFEVRVNPRRVGSMVLGMDGELLANSFVQDLKHAILRQTLSWAPLSDGYVAHKRRLGLDPRTLIATQRYVNSIQAVMAPDGTWSVEVPPLPLRPGSRRTLQDLGRWLEFGTRNMPARPHWRPVLRMWKSKVYYSKLQLKERLVNYMRKKGYI